jgi:hypothetical protein
MIHMAFPLTYHPHGKGNNLEVDMQAFQHGLELQKERSRKDAKH